MVWSPPVRTVLLPLDVGVLLCGMMQSDTMMSWLVLWFSVPHVLPLFCAPALISLTCSLFTCPSSCLWPVCCAGFSPCLFPVSPLCLACLFWNRLVFRFLFGSVFFCWITLILTLSRLYLHCLFVFCAFESNIFNLFCLLHLHLFLAQGLRP